MSRLRPVNQEPRYTRAMQLALAQIPELRERHTTLTTVRSSPAPGSLAASDLVAGPLGDLPILFALQRWGAASENALAWGLILIEAQKQPHGAHLTLLRAAMTGAAAARWLVDPSVLPRVRLARGWALECQDGDELRKFEQRGMTPRASHSAGLRRLARLRAGLRGTAGPWRTRSGAPLPLTETELCRDFAVIPAGSAINGEGLYRLESAYAHGLRWGHLTAERGAHVAMPGLDRGVAVLFTADPVLAAFATQVAVDTLRVAMDEVQHYLAPQRREREGV